MSQSRERPHSDPDQSGHVVFQDAASTGDDGSTNEQSDRNKNSDMLDFMLAALQISLLGTSYRNVL